MAGTEEAGTVTAVRATKEYAICKKHTKDPQRSMLEFMMAERLEEAVAEAQKAPAAPQRLIAGVPMAPSENFDGEAVQKVAGLAGRNVRLSSRPLRGIRSSLPQPGRRLTGSWLV